MSNAIGSQFINSLRRSVSGTTLYSQTSTNPPLLVDPTNLPGVAKAWVSFKGFTSPNNKACEIVNKSTNVITVSTTPSSNLRGDYTIDIAPGTFSNNSYMVVGSVEVNSVDPISAANTFFVKSTGAPLGGSNQTTTRIRIQAINTALSSNNWYAYASRINLIFYK